MDAPLTIILVGENPARIAILEDGLRDAGHVNAVRLADGASLLARIAAIDPDAVMIDLENPCSDRLAQMFEVSRAANRPVAMFVDQADAEAIQSSVEAGVSAFIVDGLTKARVKTILDLCISRFNAFSRLQSELAQTRSALAERKVVDRAKVILMKARNLSEENAYALLRRTAMNENKKIADVAQSVITAAALFK